MAATIQNLPKGEIDSGLIHNHENHTHGSMQRSVPKRLTPASVTQTLCQFLEEMKKAISVMKANSQQQQQQPQP